MKNVLAINEKVAFQRRKALLEKIDYNPETAAKVWKETVAGTTEKNHTNLTALPVIEADDTVEPVK